MVQNWVATLKEKTGRSLDDWLALVKKSGPKTEKERRAWLKTVHGLGMNTALGDRRTRRAQGLRIRQSGGLSRGRPEVRRKHVYMFSGPKAASLPLYDDLLRSASALGRT